MIPFLKIVLFLTLFFLENKYASSSSLYGSGNKFLPSISKIDDKEEIVIVRSSELSTSTTSSRSVYENIVEAHSPAMNENDNTNMRKNVFEKKFSFKVILAGAPASGKVRLPTSTFSIDIPFIYTYILYISYSPEDIAIEIASYLCMGYYIHHPQYIVYNKHIYI